MGLFTLCMISLSIYVTLTQGKLDAGVCSIYSITVGAFAYSKKGRIKDVKLTLSAEEADKE